MRECIHKLLILISCCYLLNDYGITFTTVLATLFAIIITGLCSYLEDSRKSEILLIICCGLLFFIPSFGIFIPLLLYDSRFLNQRISSVFLGIIALVTMYGMTLTSIIIYLFLLALAVILAKNHREILSLQQELHHTRDQSTEAEMNLRARNQALIEKQNTEIHAATLAERNRIAREIHDNVGHLLTRSILQTGALQVINKDKALKEPLSTLSDTLGTAMTSIRASVHDLHDDSIHLEYVLRDLVQNTTEPDITLKYDAGQNIPRDMKYTFISIIKESINNMQKHSNATSAHITLREHPGFYHLLIQDNGSRISFHPSALETTSATSSGMGLSNMQERVHALGGNIDFDTKHGFTIRITIMKK